MKSFHIWLLLLFVVLVLGWLPADRGLFDNEAAIGNPNPTGNTLLTGNTSLNGNTPLTGNTHLTTIPSNDNRSPDKERRWWPPTGKIRGVNLGSFLIMEPWMAWQEWYHMGCSSYKAEAGCIEGEGSNVAQAFLDHWDTWITEADLDRMKSYGLNTIRIPVGYWIHEDLVASDEHFPKGGFFYLKRVCGWATARGMFIILDLHGAPGAQVVNNSFTGQIVWNTGFYQTSQYERAYEVLTWMTYNLHHYDEFKNVGIIEVVNEPLQVNDWHTQSMASEYYPGALKAIRTQENAMQVKASSALTVQFMDLSWGGYDPMKYITGTAAANNVVFDNHFYLSKSDEGHDQDSYINYICARSFAKDSAPLMFGEWSLAVNNTPNAFAFKSGWNPDDFFRQYFAAQANKFETQGLGWTFWSWKTNQTGYQWDYQKAVTAGIIPIDPSKAASSDPCSGN